jgi:orotate phosphoribosyltransferase
MFRINCEFEQDLIDRGVLLSGHFKLSSGKHSANYLQCAKIFQDANFAQKICASVANKVNAAFGPNCFDIIASPAMGGILVGYELSRALNLPNIFFERVDSNFTLRRGFEVSAGARVLLVEDVITTGKSSMEVYNLLRQMGAEEIQFACIFDRTHGNSIHLPHGSRIVSLAQIDIETFDPENIPESLRNIVAVKPGSRKIP